MTRQREVHESKWASVSNDKLERFPGSSPVPSLEATPLEPREHVVIGRNNKLHK
jgi:hypothetical protein